MISPMPSVAESVMLGDMLVVEESSPELMRALAVIASLHEAYDRLPWLAVGKSKESCVLASLTVRDFLWRIGFKDAQCRSVYYVIRAWDSAGQELHSIGVGDHYQVPASHRNLHKLRHDRWSGHLVVVIPSLRCVIDPTLYQVIRPQWSTLPGMIAIPLLDKPEQLWNMDVIAALEAKEGDSLLAMMWLDQPGNDGWHTAPDKAKERRADVVKAMVKLFNKENARYGSNNTDSQSERVVR
jgi:hypothetical protein